MRIAGTGWHSVYLTAACWLLAVMAEAQPASWHEVAPGVRYGQYATTAPLSIHILMVDLSAPDLRVEAIPGHDDLHQRERPSELAARVSRPGWRVLAATNGDLGNRKGNVVKNGPAGFFARDGRMMTNATSKASLAFDADGLPRIDYFTTILDLRPANNPGAGQLTIDWLNHWYDIKMASLFTAHYGWSEDWEQPVAEFTLRMSEEYTLGLSALPPLRDEMAVDVLPDERVTTGGTAIQPGQAILQVPLDSPWRAALANPEVKWQLVTATVPAISDARSIVTGAGQVARDGKVDVTARRERLSAAFAEARHPRTAAGYSADRKTLIMCVVDGRQPGYSIGVSLDELGQIMIANGAATALNLDGGGSSCMVVDGEVVNRPADPGGERAVTSALCVISTAP